MALNVVVIGTGFGERTVAPAYRSLGCEVAVVSPRDRRAIAGAVAAPCDLVSIHSPPFMHLEHVELALAHGRHVLCDKPFGRNAGEAQRMLELATAAGLLHFLNFEFRFDPMREQLKHLLDEGAIGEPQHLAGSMFTSMSRDAPFGWKFERDLGGGWIGAYGSHHVDALHWLFGEIDAVSCLSRIEVPARADTAAGGRMRETSAEDAFTAWFRLGSGVTSSLDTACCSAVNLPSQLTLYGAEGVLQLTHNLELVLRRPAEEPRRFPAAENSNAVRIAQERWLGRVCEAIATGSPTAPDFTTGLACARILDLMRAGATPGWR